MSKICNKIIKNLKLELVLRKGYMRYKIIKKRKFTDLKRIITIYTKKSLPTKKWGKNTAFIAADSILAGTSKYISYREEQLTTW